MDDFRVKIEDAGYLALREKIYKTAIFDRLHNLPDLVNNIGFSVDGILRRRLYFSN